MRSVATDKLMFSYPWSSYGIFLNYRLPCNTTRISNPMEELGKENMLVLQVNIHILREYSREYSLRTLHAAPSCRWQVRPAAPGPS